MIPRLVLMPEFAQPTHGFHHTIDSALAVLAAMGVPDSRITIRMAGLGWPSLRIVEQSPKAGSTMGADTRVMLSVAGLGFFQALPTGMWESGGEEEPGTRELAELFDDPLQKAGFWIRQGARLFDVSPSDLTACSRWIALFGIDPGEWPQPLLYRLALLLPSLHKLAGREAGIRFALDTLLRLPLAGIRRGSEFLAMAEEDLTLLGQRYTRLGIDWILGDRAEDLARLTLVLGPVPLATYRQYQEADQRRLLERVLDLCFPAHQSRSIHWVVEDVNGSPRLGLELANARLGVNSWMGLTEPPAVPARGRKGHC